MNDTKTETKTPEPPKDQDSNFPPIRPGHMFCVFCGQHPSKHAVTCQNPFAKESK